MSARRTLQRLLSAGAVALAAACGGAVDRASDLEPAEALELGREAGAALVAAARAPEMLARGDVVALGYLERLRLGLGSPFRLADHALADARLEPAARRALAFAILARTFDGRAFEIEPAALAGIGDGVRLTAGDATPTGAWATGAAHLRLIESAVREARDPRAGELAVRIAYALAAAEGAVGRSGPTLAAQAAAVIRDRELARRDVRRLLEAADEADADPLVALEQWREARRFLVEQPLGTPIPVAVEEEAIALAERLAAAIRTLDPRAARGAVSVHATPGLLTEALARRLAAVADSLDYPAQAPIVMAVQLHRDALLAPRQDAADSANVRRFMRVAVDEESFVAAHALLDASGAVPAGTLARIALAAAVTMRPYAQEPVWFPGDGGPSEPELVARYGLAEVAFDASVPASWRPYYRRMIAAALTDLQRVLPSLSVRGLTIRVAPIERSPATLAMHDPRTRTLYLPPGTGAGTIAHELAHDLDWQVALRRFRVRGDYATDRATRRGTGALAASVRNLAVGALEPPLAGAAEAQHDRRPAEVFARSVDYMVTLMLARDGRMNGYLSSVQDGVLTGYGSVRPPDFTGRAGDALVSILDQVAPLPTRARTWYVEHQGLSRTLGAYDLLRTVLEAPIPDDEGLVLFAPAGVSAVDSVTGHAPPPPTQVVGTRFDALAEARDEALAEVDAWICGAPGAAYDRELQDARRGLVLRATTARARGIALRRAGEIGGHEGRRWVAREFFGEAFPSAAVDSMAARLLGTIVERAREIGRTDIGTSQSFRLFAPPERCLLGVAGG